MTTTNPGRAATTGALRGWERRSTSRDRRRSPLVEPLESRHLLAAVTEAAHLDGEAPVKIATGPDGRIWFVAIEAQVVDMSLRSHVAPPTQRIGFFDPATGTTAEFNLPGDEAGDSILGLTGGPDGHVWFTETASDNPTGDHFIPASDLASRVGMIDPTTHAITAFPIPTIGAGAGAIVAGSDGNLWFAEQVANQIGMIDPTTHAVAEFPLPDGYTRPTALAAGPDGNVWFTETKVSDPLTETPAIGVIDLKTHAIEELNVPTAVSAAVVMQDLVSGPDGRLWWSAHDYVTQADVWGVVDPSTHAISEFGPPGGFIEDLTSGPDGNLWVFGPGYNQLGVIDPRTHQLKTELTLPGADAGSTSLTPGPDGNLWFVAPTNVGILENSSGTIDVVALTRLVVTQPSPAEPGVGTPFGLTVTAEYDSGAMNVHFHGPVTVALANGPAGASLGGTPTVAAEDGVATFAGLTLDTVGAAYVLRASGIDTADGQTAPFSVAGPTPTTGAPAPAGEGPPTMIGERVLASGRGRHHHLTGFELDFDMALDPARAANPGNYSVAQAVKRGRKTAFRPVAFRVAPGGSGGSVILTLSRRARFVRGGRIVVNVAPPGGLVGSSAQSDGGDGPRSPHNPIVLTIVPGARSLQAGG